MRIRTRSISRTTHTTTIDDIEVELECEPHCEDDVLAEKVGDKLVVAYLVHDDSPSNPMTDCDCQGNLYTRNERVIPDNEGELYSALGLDHYGQPDIDNLFPCEPYIDWRGIQQKRSCLRDIAARQYLDKVGADFDLIQQWLDANDYELVEDETLDEAFAERRNEVWRNLEDCNGTFSEEVEALAVSLYPEYWQQVAGPFVVPMHYFSERGGTSITPTPWDGDTDDLPNAVWVADRGAIENITPYPDNVSLKQVVCWPEPSVYAVIRGEEELFRSDWSAARRWIKDNLPAPNEDDLRAGAVKYAEAVCKEYASWCEGDVYGCVVQVFELDDDVWVEQDDHEAVWGFIGHDHAEEALKSEFFDPTVAGLKKEVTA